MPALPAPRHRGIFPAVLTTFRADGAPDLASQRRCLDFSIARRLDPLAPRRAG